ncbi:hypothetical protein LCGC14_2067110 [marine sediment metagenome]|uniref:Uncharacterized protein n=1 Tax=marine sediment metagenome TaxID=412755 RepID=A0A0F9F6U4_9ZZZZ
MTKPMTIEELREEPARTVRIMSEDGISGIATGANIPTEEARPSESKIGALAGQAYLETICFRCLIYPKCQGAMMGGCLWRDQECQQRVERIKRKIEEGDYYISKDGVYLKDCWLIPNDEWQAIWKEEGM